MDYDFPTILGISSSQLTFTPFFRGVGLNHQRITITMTSRRDVTGMMVNVRANHPHSWPYDT